MKTLSAEGFPFVDSAEFFALECENVSHNGSAFVDNRAIMAEQRPLINILPVGWNHAAWNGEFYPEDLPPEWRLSYFANEFPGVLIPQQDWCVSENQGLRSWSDDVVEGFRFFLTLNQMLDLEVRVDVANSLEGNFGGFVIPARMRQRFAGQDNLQTPEINYYTLLCKEFAFNDRSLRGFDARQIAFLISMSDLPDLKGQRLFLERIATEVTADAEVLLFIQGDPPELDSLRDFRTLAQLLGFA